MIGSIVSQLTTGEGAKSFDRYGVGAYYMDHANAVYPSNAGGVPFTAAYIQSKVIKFLREREVVHFQRFGEVLDILQSQIK